MIPDERFWKDRRVLLTGHTGFKGSWAAAWLKRLGARIVGFALPPDTTPSLWRGIGEDLLDDEVLGDVADLATLRSVVERARPSVVLHLAAQSLVRRSFARPVQTFATNVMGTVHLLEALRGAEGLEAVLVVTSDKVYADNGIGRPHIEADPLGGSDPYSASKAAAEMAVASYSAFFASCGAGIATARAGNVIGGGDWSEDRLVPDVWRAASLRQPLFLRNPDAIRPWQHVLEPLAGYLGYAEALAEGRELPASLNFGPPPGQGRTVAELAEAMADALGGQIAWRKDDRPAPAETSFLSVDSTCAAQALGWRPRLSCAEAVDWSARWYCDWQDGSDPLQLCFSQIERYEALA
jgi:CDP-glucose 4,6-dehydratase